MSQVLNERGIFQIQIGKGNGDKKDPELELCILHMWLFTSERPFKSSSKLEAVPAHAGCFEQDSDVTRSVSGEEYAWQSGERTGGWRGTGGSTLAET